MKRCSMLMAVAAMMVVAPMIVSADCGTCGTDAKKSETKSCCPAKATCTKEQCKEGCKCPQKATCTKESSKDGDNCAEKETAKKSCCSKK